MPEHWILIVGAGIAGLVLGRALRAHGFQTEIVERAAAWGAGRSGIYVPANGVRALSPLGLAEAIAARGTHAELLLAEGRYAELYRTQFAKSEESATAA